MKNRNYQIVQQKTRKFNRLLVINSLVVLVLLFILSLCGIHTVKDVGVITWLDDICNNVIIYNVLVFCILFLNIYVVLRPSCPERHPIWIVLVTLISLAYKIPLYIYSLTFVGFVCDIMYILIVVFILKGNILTALKMLIFIGIVQILISCIRDYWLSDILSNKFSIYVILNIDLLMFAYALGGETTCGDASCSGESQLGCTQSQDSFSVLSKFRITLSKELLMIPKLVTTKAKQLKSNIKSPLDCLYLILYPAWNAFTFYLVYVIAQKNYRITEVAITALVFIANKMLFGKPLHLSSDICFIVSLIIFYTISRMLPSLSVSIIIPVVIGLSLSMIGSIINEIFSPITTKSLRNRIIAIVGDDKSTQHIYDICKKKGYTDAKAEEISQTVATYLKYSLYETADIVHCDQRTVTRRINSFLRD